MANAMLSPDRKVPTGDNPTAFSLEGGDDDDVSQHQPHLSSAATTTASSSSTANANPLVLPSDLSLSSLLTKLSSYNPSHPLPLIRSSLSSQGCFSSDPQVSLLVAAAVDRVVTEVLTGAGLCRDLRCEEDKEERRRRREEVRREKEEERIRGRGRNRGGGGGGGGKRRKKGGEVVEEETEDLEEINGEESDTEEEGYEQEKEALLMEDFVKPLKVWGVDLKGKGC